jgi:acyl-CoA reductase-like NAD-dependent aldehyde dehydrogenase
MYINGAWLGAADGRELPAYDPSSGTVLAEVAVSSRENVREAVASAKAAGETWRDLLPVERGRRLMRTAQLLRDSADRMARIESLNNGKPLREARSDIRTAARYFEYYAGIADKLQGDSIPLGPNYVSFTLHEPVGVTAHVIPWNFPLATTARGLAPALAAGCTAVVKPAEETPLSALLLAPLLAEAGLPKGVYNVVTGPGEETGAALVADPDIAHITFTGAVETGRIVMTHAASHIASVTLELGGKSPLTVLADADLDAALAGVLRGIFTNSGQLCSASSRLIVERKIADAFLERVVAAAASLRIGRGLDDPDLGPLVSARQLATVAGYVSAARQRNVPILTGGRLVEMDGLKGGWFYEPTILMCPDPGDKIVQEEIFGPVLAVQIADDFEHAIELANGTNFGLVGGIYTADIRKAMRFAREVEAGQIFINEYFAGGVETPFGGVKRSGFGREKGIEAVRSYSRIKTVTTRI